MVLFLWHLPGMETIHYSIYVAIRTAPVRVRRRLSAKLATEGDEAADELATILLKALLGAYDIRKKPRSADNWPSTDSR